MDRSKSLTGARGPKSKITQQPPDLFIALGAKQSSSRDDAKRAVPLVKPSTSSHLPSTSTKVDKLKREGSSSSLSHVPAPKKLKVALPGNRPALPGASSSTLLPTERSSAGSVEPWENLVIECDSSELFENILNSFNVGNTDKAIGYILGAIKGLRGQRFKLCKIVYSSLLLTCSCKPTLFTNENVLAAMMSLIRKDVTSGLKGANKMNSYIHILFINLFSYAFSDVGHWPEVFVKLYVEDAVADRVWIDNPYCKPFVDNIITAFNTKLPPKSLLLSETWSTTVRDTSSPLTVNNVDDDEAFSEHKSIVDNWNVKTYSRFTQNQENVEQIVLEAIKEQLARRQQPEAITKNFVRFLSIACGLVEIRVIAVSRIETWLHNHKLMKAAQELLAYLCYNCSASSQRDIEVIAQLSKLRLKNKPMINFFNNCLREMVYSFPENLYPLLKYTIYNELSNARNNNNLIVVGALFQVAPEASADAFADICLELLLNKDDYLRSLRALLKEINRVLRHDFNLLSVVHSLVRERKEFANSVRDSEFKDRVFLSLADLSCMCMLLCITPQVRDAATQSKRDTSVLKAFQVQVSNIQREVVTWLQDSALRIFRPNINDFHHVLLKILFLEQAEHYYKIDNWPGENERNLFLRLASEVPLLQATLLRILLIGISKEHPLNPTEALEICDQLIKRAANLPPDCAPPLVVDKVEIFEICFNLCSYNYPENITLPAGYVPPNLAISGLYWKVWLMLLILATHNPSSFGHTAWEKYPTLKMFMEMCITNHFSFPPPTSLAPEDDYQSREQQILALEKQKILEFESHLAAASTKKEINEQTSLLLPQLMDLNPEGEARRPPQAVLDQLRNLNTTHRMGHLLCRSRNPDFLLDIMSRQGGTAHMPWLAELVHSSEGALAHLPVQCLCEYLLSTAPTEKLTKHGQLLAHLRTVVNSNDPQMGCEVLEYLFRRLTSEHGASRTQATKALSLILSPAEEAEANVTNTNWLSQFIYQFPHFAVIKPILIQFLRQALQIETNPSRVSSYINFLSVQDMPEFGEFNDLVIDLSSVIIERNSVASYVLPGEDNPTVKNLLTVFYTHAQKSKEFAKETFTLLQNYSTTDYVIISWPTGEQCAMQMLVIHAAIVLLTYGPFEVEDFKLLLSTWFPSNMEHPRAFAPDTSECTSYLPDWIKLRMIRSNVACLVDAAIEKLEPPKLVLFIQSFGIPTASISKLLHTLDKATLINPRLVVDSVIDKAYMIQLVEVQNKRGANGGKTFVKSIEMQAPVTQEAAIKVEVDGKRALRQPSKRSRSSDDVDKLLEDLCCQSGSENNIILRIIKEISSDRGKLSRFFLALNSKDYALPSIVKLKSSVALFQLLLNSDISVEEKSKFSARLLKCVTEKSSPIYTLLSKYASNPEVAMDASVSDTAEHSTVLGEKLGKLLVEDKEQAEKTGVLVDWLSAMELEVVPSDKHKLQMDLLFGRDKLSFRPLLMSLVLQRSSWQSLNSIMTYLLRGDISKICPTSALDFFTALTQSPKLWQGRDKAIPKHYHFEDVLQLNGDQVNVLVTYTLEEAKSSPDEWRKQMESRMQLLLKCLGNSAPQIVKNLFDESEENEFARELMLMIYMSIPAAGQEIIQPKAEIAREAFGKNSPSTVDEISHCLLSALAATPRTKDWNRKSQDLEICARKLASTHPVLVLRQLPMVAGCLKGRAQYDWGVLKNRGHLTLFKQMFGIVELLQPIVFEQSEIICDLLDSYFLLLQYHGHAKELTPLIYRFVAFVQNWMLKDVKAASRYLQKQGHILSELQNVQPAVRPLLSCVSLSAGAASASSDCFMGVVTPPSEEPPPQQWSQLINAAQSDNFNALQEIDHLTNKRPDLLKDVCYYLYIAIGSNHSSIRSLALLLIIRWLKHNPRAASEALPAILKCLDSNNGDIVSSVLDRLSDIVSVMQEYAQDILNRVFRLGMKSTLNTTTNISDSISILSLQSGC